MIKLLIFLSALSCFNVVLCDENISSGLRKLEKDEDLATTCTRYAHYLAKYFKCPINHRFPSTSVYQHLIGRAIVELLKSIDNETVILTKNLRECKVIDRFMALDPNPEHDFETPTDWIRKKNQIKFLTIKIDWFKKIRAAKLEKLANEYREMQNKFRTRSKELNAKLEKIRNAYDRLTSIFSDYKTRDNFYEVLFKYIKLLDEPEGSTMIEDLIKTYDLQLKETRHLLDILVAKDGKEIEKTDTNLAEFYYISD